MPGLPDTHPDEHDQRGGDPTCQRNQRDRLFAAEGAEGTTIRAVASEAGVDPMLVLHYFGSKDGLFTAAIEWPLDFNEIDRLVLDPGIDGLGERLLRFFLAEWEAEQTRTPLMIMYRRGLSRAEHGRLLAEFVEDQLGGVSRRR